MILSHCHIFHQITGFSGEILTYHIVQHNFWQVSLPPRCQTWKCSNFHKWQCNHCFKLLDCPFTNGDCRATSILSEIPMQRLISVFLSFPLQNISFYKALIGNMYQDQSCFQVDVFLVTWCSCQDIPSSSENKVLNQAPMNLAWENSQHFATPPLVSMWNDVWTTSAEIPYWWCVTTQISLFKITFAFPFFFFPKLTLEATVSTCKFSILIPIYLLEGLKHFVLGDYFIYSPNLFFLRCIENVRRKLM